MFSCLNHLGTFECACKPGFDASGGVCADFNECLHPGKFSCPKDTSDCVNLPGNYTCTRGITNATRAIMETTRLVWTLTSATMTKTLNKFAETQRKEGRPEFEEITCIENIFPQFHGSDPEKSSAFESPRPFRYYLPMAMVPPMVPYLQPSGQAMVGWKPRLQRSNVSLLLLLFYVSRLNAFFLPLTIPLS